MTASESGETARTPARGANKAPAATQGSGAAPKMPATPPAAKKTAFIVLAMHRSGSSAITRALEALGVSLGDNLMPAGPDNKKGFFEDLDIEALNDRLLRRVGSEWDRLTPVDASALKGPEFTAERVEAYAILRARFDKSLEFGFKDPRTCLLLPFWQTVLDDLEIDAKYIIAVRDPLAIAESLRRRDGMPVAHGLFLWARYTLSSLHGTEDQVPLYVSYDHLVEHPEPALVRMAEGLGLDSPAAGSAAASAFCNEFLDRGLRHNAVAPAELARTQGAAPFMVALRDSLNAAAMAPHGTASPDERALATWQAEYHALAPLLPLADRALVFGNTDRDKDAEIARLRPLAEDRLVQIAEAAILRAELATRVDETEELQQLGWKVQAQDRLLTSLRGIVAARDDEIATLNADVTLRHRANLALGRERDQFALEAKTQAETLARLETENAALHATVQNNAAAVARTEELEALVRDKTVDLRLARAALRQIRTSTSWTLTTPLRVAASLIRRPTATIKNGVRLAGRILWHLIPLGTRGRGALAQTLFRRVPFAVSWSGYYKVWAAQQRDLHAGAPGTHVGTDALPPDGAPVLAMPPAPASGSKKNS